MKPIRVGVDARPLTAPLSGVSRVISRVLERFPDRNGFIFELYASRPPHADFGELTRLPYIRWMEGRGPLASRAGLWFNFALPQQLRERPVDLFWGSQQVLPPFLPRSTPAVLTFYDLVLYFYPETMRPLARLQQRLVMHYSVRRARSIYSISQQTSDDMQRRFGFPADRAGVALLGYEPQARPPGRLRKQMLRELERRLGFKPDENFILAVSTIEPRKNYSLLLDAWLQYRAGAGRSTLPLVIAGRRGWESPEFYARLDRARAETGAVFTLEGLSDRMIDQLYETCAFFCMPSLYEGFGLPLLEALCHRKHALASDIPCFHEIGGDYAEYLPPQDVGAWAEALAAYARLARKGKLGRVKFPAAEWNWERTARVYHDAFLAALDAPRQR